MNKPIYEVNQEVLRKLDVRSVKIKEVIYKNYLFGIIKVFSGSYLCFWLIDGQHNEAIYNESELAHRDEESYDDLTPYI